MKRLFFSILTGVLFTGISFSQANPQVQSGASASQGSSVSQRANGADVQSGAAAQANGDAAISSQSPDQSAQVSTANQVATSKTVQARLEKPVDARKNKPGDEVIAKTTQATTSSDGVAIPKGSKIIGHVTEAKARQKGESESAVGVIFDHALLKDGRQILLTASIQAISASQQIAPDNFADDQAMTNRAGMAGTVQTAEPGRGMAGGAGTVATGATNRLGGATNSVGSTAAGTINGAASVPNGAASGTLSSTSHGVVGMNGLELNADAANSTEGSVITSTSKNVHLDSGTEMILQVTK
ncbi:MAG TPA: hypothetical protein VGN39_16825 [Terriglobales bacterium]|jgi:hypothetical protein|nr:hypothetical protein [Terriglobales bacterium]